MNKTMIKLGLIGYKLEHSFSKGYFTEKFQKENIDHICYENFSIENISYFPQIVEQEPRLYGVNVTIPYKESIIPYLDEISDLARETGAVNTVRIERNQDRPYLKGYNTDVPGFKETITPFADQLKKALVLGSGGASKAIIRALEELGIKYLLVSRKSSKDAITYKDIDDKIIDTHQLIVNCTPLGMKGYDEVKPPLPYHNIKNSHFLYDLIYNPTETPFLLEGKKRGAKTKNGREMLERQAEHSWDIWENVLKRL